MTTKNGHRDAPRAGRHRTRALAVAGLLALGGGAVVATAAAALLPSGLAAQEEERCRCVDEDGNELERCTCFRMPDVEGLMAEASVMMGRPRLGVSIDADQSGDTDSRGALVRDVMEGGPADEAGLRAGDVITSVDGRSLTSSLGADLEEDFDLDASIPVQRLLAVTRELEPGSDVEVEYLRDGEPRTATVRVRDLSDRWGREMAMVMPRRIEEIRERARDLAGERRWRMRPEAPRPPRAPGLFEYRFGPGALRDGLRVAPMNEGLSSYFGTDEGVLVLDADTSSPLGLRAGDVVLGVDGRDVASPERFHRILASYGDDEEMTFRVVREGSETTVTGRLRAPR